MSDALKREGDWLEEVDKVCEKKRLATGVEAEESSTDETLLVNWSTYHAMLKKSLVRPKCTSALLPLFPDCAHSVAMIRHSMAVVRDAVQFINQGQTPVIAFDQPLFALAKEIQ